MAYFKNELTQPLIASMARQDKVTNWVEALASCVETSYPTNKVEAGEESSSSKGDRLRVLVDGDSQRMVTRLYQEYVSEENFVLFIEFVKSIDNLIVKYREMAQSRDIASQVKNDEEDDDDDYEPRGRGRGGRGGNGKGMRRGPPPARMADNAVPPTEDYTAEDSPSATVAALAKLFK